MTAASGNASGSRVCRVCNQTCRLDAAGALAHNAPTLYGPAHEPIVRVHEMTAGGWTACGKRVSTVLVGGEETSPRQEDATCDRCAEVRERADRYLAESRAKAPTIEALLGRGRAPSSLLAPFRAKSRRRVRFR